MTKPYSMDRRERVVAAVEAGQSRRAVILTSSTYAGRHAFNVKEAKTAPIRPQSDWIMVEVPPIIPEAT